MLLTVSTTRAPATDLGHLLHKHPDRVQTFAVGFGNAHVFYPEATEARCTAALLLDVDPVGLIRRGGGRSAFALAEYVNDRPYVASSFLSVAISSVFKTAMNGVSQARPEVAASPMALEAWMPAVPARGGEALVRRIFEPLGYVVEATPLPLDPASPEWGHSRHVELRLTAEVRLADLLNHLYVLLPVLDDDKHYWVDEAEIEKLLRRGAGWLPSHPARDLIVRRYLKRQARLFHPALAQLDEVARKLKLDLLPDAQRERIKLLHSPLTYRDKRLAGYDAAALVEVIEHFDPPRLAAAEQNVFGSARPGTVVVTTPNAEYNVRWESLPAGEFRHPDHRFEWTRAEFRTWSETVAARHGYSVRFLPVGPEDPAVGPPTQMGVFER